MKALSVWQPWGFLIFRPDLVGIRRAASLSRGLLKDIENRPRRWNLTGDVVICATQKLDPNDKQIRADMLKRYGIDIPDRLPTGGILGVVTFGKVVTSHPSFWFTGPFGYPLSNIRPLPFIAMAGAQGIFNLKPQYDVWVRNQLDKL